MLRGSLPTCSAPVFTLLYWRVDELGYATDICVQLPFFFLILKSALEAPSPQSKAALSFITA